MPKVIPFGDRILCKRRKIGEKIGSVIIAPDVVSERPTDLADVLYVPDLTFGDTQILDNADKIIDSLTKKACEGDDEALIALFRINEFVKIKSIKRGDAIMIGLHCGVTFHETGSSEDLVLIRDSEVIGLVVEGDKDGK